MKYLKKYNESIKHLLKPRSEEDIKKILMNSNSSNKLDNIFKFKLNNLFNDDEILKICKNLNPADKLHNGIRYNIPSLIKQSLIDGANPGLYNQNLLKFICREGYNDILKMLLKDDRVKPAVNDNLPIAYAAENGHIETVKILMNDKRVDPSDYKNAAIMYALKNGHLDIVKELLKDKRVVDKLSVQDKVNIKTELAYKTKSMINSIDNWIEKRKKELE